MSSPNGTLMYNLLSSIQGGTNGCTTTTSTRRPTCQSGTETAFAVSKAAANGPLPETKCFRFISEISTLQHRATSSKRCAMQSMQGTPDTALVPALSRCRSRRRHRAARGLQFGPNTLLFNRAETCHHQVHPDADEPRRQCSLPKPRLSDL